MTKKKAGPHHGPKSPHRLTVTVKSTYCQKWITDILTEALRRWGWQVSAIDGVITGVMRG